MKNDTYPGFVLFGKHVIEVVFNLIRDGDTGLDGTGSPARWTSFPCGDIGFGPDPLPGNLRAAEFRNGEDRVFGAISAPFIFQ